ncbi:helix-turn-helix transcriptional regulator [Clostridium estertheticum]|uniref:winged helix-turn-helix transcriptional regulator n=1 Tax=Clostridium estertheticum TaxID=238834 RepID=UPI0013E96D07|nr:helix-turn-helix domain-containing protein [Clostridium estertheticum]MBZ9688503.1 helix-turn-helix transcriptional regulator [Clostridium estertheticum]
MINEYNESNITECPVASVQKIISGKWNMVIIYFLSKGTMRFGELKRKLPNLTQATLTKQLRSLEEYEMIHREIYKQIPPKVEYSLTEIGVKFLPVMSSLEEWAIQYEKYKTSKV